MHLLLDLDGTLTDPKPGILNCIRYALDEMEIDVPPDSRLESCIGPPLRDSFRELCGKGSSEQRICNASLPASRPTSSWAYS